MRAKESKVKSMRTLGAMAVGGLLAAGIYAIAQPEAKVAHASEPDGLASRTVYACDHRKVVVVEGFEKDQKLPPEKAQQVADLLSDLMRFCNEEVTAHIAANDVVKLSINGMPFVEYVPGGPLPTQLVVGKSEVTERDKQIWKAELDKLVKEGDRLFHSDEIGTNGLACAMCHPNASNTHPETYPKFQMEMKQVALLRDMVNWCIQNPLEGAKLTDDDPKMRALEAYILSQRTGVAMAAGKH
jgi:thiosulfate dehydrogenase